MNTTTAVPRVLIVDDEENIRFLVGSALQLAGFETEVAETGVAGTQRYARLVAERVLVLQMPRALWMGGLVLSAACAVVSLVVWHPAPLAGVSVGLLFASFPLIARLDAVKLDGPYLSARKAIRWVGPVDLRTLVVLSYLPKTARRPPVWLLIQREAGARFRWYWRMGVERDIRSRLSGQRGLRVLEVAAGGALSQLPGLADHLAHYVLPSDAFVEPRAHAALQRLRG